MITIKAISRIDPYSERRGCRHRSRLPLNSRAAAASPAASVGANLRNMDEFLLGETSGQRVFGKVRGKVPVRQGRNLPMLSIAPTIADLRTAGIGAIQPVEQPPRRSLFKVF